MKRVTLLILVLAASPALAADAGTETFHYFYYKMLNTRADPLPVWMNDVNPTGVPVNDAETATQAAIQTWNGVQCSWGQFKYMGRVSVNDAGIVDPEDDGDAFSVSTNFVSDAGDPYYTYALQSGTVISSSVALTYDGELYQCDVYLNDVPVLDSPPGPLWSTATPTPDSQLDVQTFLTHELGHCMGLADSVDVDFPGYVMYGNIGLGQQNRTLKQHDIDQVCNWLPISGQVGSPCTQASDCGAGKACVAITRPDGTAGKMCTVGCTPADGGTDPCELPFTCQPSSAVGGYSDACLPTADAPVTRVGKPCDLSQPPDACGSAYAECEAEDGGTPQPSGYSYWPGGYCSQDCANNACPSGSACADYLGGPICLKSCGSLTDCRPGYTCVSAGLATPVCVVACHQDRDCPTGFQCHVSDGACVQQQGSGQIGAPCTSDASCLGGLVCYGAGAGSVGVCAQACGTAWTACPASTTCHALPASGSSAAGLYCVRDCQTGTCPSGDMCAPVESGQGCLPGCQSSAQCPAGSTCQGGECYGAPPDAGCESCGVDAGTVEDAGVPPPSQPPGQSSSGAFGCQASPAGSSGFGGAGAALFALLLLSMLSGRGRTWRKL